MSNQASAPPQSGTPQEPSVDEAWRVIKAAWAHNRAANAAVQSKAEAEARKPLLVDLVRRVEYVAHMTSLSRETALAVVCEDDPELAKKCQLSPAPLGSLPETDIVGRYEKALANERQALLDKWTEPGRPALTASARARLFGEADRTMRQKFAGLCNAAINARAAARHEAVHARHATKRNDAAYLEFCRSRETESASAPVAAPAV